MNPRLIDDMSYAMAEVYEAVTDRIILNMARYFPAVPLGEEPRQMFNYQTRMLAKVGQLTKETEEIILQQMTGADDALKAGLEAAIRDALKDAEPPLRKAAEKRLLMGGGMLPPEMEPGMMQAFSAFYSQSANKLNLVNTVMLESTQQAYLATVADITNQIEILERVGLTQSILNVSTGEVVSGASPLNRAVSNAVEKMVKNGLTGFVDHGGHKWSPEAYVMMDIRTTMANTGRAAVWERQDAYGNDLYQVSYHDGARPLCYDWQGKVISRADAARDVEDENGNTIHVYAQSETSYGEPAGLFGINCKHYPIPFVPGFSRIRPPQQDAEENAIQYENSQKQRALERKLRAERLNLMIAQERGDAEAEARAKARVDAADDAIEAFCDHAGLARRRSREWTPIKAEWPDI